MKKEVSLPHPVLIPHIFNAILGVFIISGTGAAICTVIVVEECNGR
jgi:hypothetical protein